MTTNSSPNQSNEGYFIVPTIITHIEHILPAIVHQTQGLLYYKTPQWAICQPLPIFNVNLKMTMCLGSGRGAMGRARVFQMRCHMFNSWRIAVVSGRPSNLKCSCATLVSKSVKKKLLCLMC